MSIKKWHKFRWTAYWNILLLYQLSKNYNEKDIGLYGDEGLTIFKNVNGYKAEQIKKDIEKLFKDNHLNITIQCGLNYLDVTFNLSNAT